MAPNSNDSDKISNDVKQINSGNASAKTSSDVNGKINSGAKRINSGANAKTNSGAKRISNANGNGKTNNVDKRISSVVKPNNNASETGAIEAGKCYSE